MSQESYKSVPFEDLSPAEQRVLIARLTGLLESITASMSDLLNLYPDRFGRIRRLQEEIKAFLRLAALLPEPVEETDAKGGDATND